MSFFPNLILPLTLLFVYVSLTSSLFVSADEGSSPSTLVKKGTWSETVRDFIATTQDDFAYRRLVLQEFLSGAQGNSFAAAVCSRPDVMKCLGGNPNDNRASADQEAWPIEVTIKKFNGTVHWEKLPKATRTLVIQDSPIAVDVVDLISRLPNGIETLRFVRCQLSTSGGNIFVRNHDQQQDDDTNNKNDGGNSSPQRNNIGDNAQLVTLTSVSFEWCTMDATVLETGWLPVGALKFFGIEHCSFSAPSIAPLLVSATELEHIRIVSNHAPIRFRDLLAELSVRTGIKIINFQAGMFVKDNERIASLAENGDENAMNNVNGGVSSTLFPPNLVQLRLCNMSLKSIPRKLPTKLRNLELPYNKISGKMDPFIAETILELIDLSNNSLSEYPSALPRSIKRLRLPSNKMKGTIDFSAFPKQLEEINVAHNQLSGTVDFLSKLFSQNKVS